MPKETVEITVMSPAGRSIQVVPGDWTLRTLHDEPNQTQAPMALAAPSRGIHAMAVVVPPAEFEALVARFLALTVFGGES